MSFGAAQQLRAVYLPTKGEQREIEGATRLKNVSLFNFDSGYRQAPESDQKKQVASKANLKSLNLTPMQWTKINSRVVSRDGVEKWLSPRQIAKLSK